MAAESARLLKERIRKMEPSGTHALLFTMRGVSAANKNDWPAARQDFLDAYSLDSVSAFSLNNRGYVAERDGDLETAKFFYEKAKKASDSNARVGLATQRSAEGKRLSTVATDSNHKVDGELERYSEDRRRETAPIELVPRNAKLEAESLVPPEEHSAANGVTGASSSSETQFPQ
jgi:tetratricopeptide (TPR) repeat protein